MPIETFTLDTGARIPFDTDALCLIVQVPLEEDGLRPFRVLGTGFYFMRADTIVTAAHVFTEADEDWGPHFIYNLKPARGETLGHHLAIPRDVRQHRNVDVAVVTVDPTECPPVIPLFPADHDMNQDLGFATAGYMPKDSQWIDGENRAHLRLQVDGVTDIKIEERERDEVEYSITYDAPFAQRGNSGGPLLAHDGKVVGVITEMFSTVQASDDSRAIVRGRATSIRTVAKCFLPDPRFASLVRLMHQWQEQLGFTNEIPQ